MPVFALSEDLVFPPPRLASPEGLLAVGGDLSQERLLLAYRMGIFPWFMEEEPVLWWSPDPRLVLYVSEFHISRSLQRVLRRGDFEITMDQAFEEVMRQCAGARNRGREGTWIVPEMIEAYCRLHRSGFAHSVEAWNNGRLAGGLYGISLGRCFFGESMFSAAPNASKAALAGLVAHLRAAGDELIDCQVTTGHLQRMGAREIPRKRYLVELEQALEADTRVGCWPYSAQAMAALLTPRRAVAAAPRRRKTAAAGRKKAGKESRGG